MLRHSLGSVVILLMLACGPSVTPGGPDGAQGVADSAPGLPGTLRIEPATAEVTVEGGVAATVDYHAIYTNDAGVDEDVTAEAIFSLGNVALGGFAGALFTSATDRGGHTTVSASARGKFASADLTVRLKTIVIGPGAPPNAPDLFGGAVDASRSPELVYPNDGTLVPPNLNELEIHYLPGSGNTLFELTVLGSAVELRAYFSCQALGAGCGFTPAEDTWVLLADSERGQLPVSYTLRGVDGTTPGTVGVSATRTLGFGQVDIVGGLYYWNAAAGAIRRYDFGRRGQSAENYMDAAQAGASTCVGCHVLSRDGTRIAVGLDIPAPSPYKVFDVATKALVYQQGTMFGGGANFFSFSPDSLQVMSSNGISIVWRDSASGVAIQEPLVAVGTMPDWSPDGLKLVYAKPAMAPPCFGGFCGAPGVDQASLEVIPYDGATWGGATTLVPYGGQNNYYPAYSPDAGWVMFNRSPSNVNSFDAPDAQVWVVSAAGGAPIHMATASTGGDSWPKWAPDVQTYRGGSLMWFTFSSRRAYGLRTAAGATAQLWMAAYDPARAAMGLDPSVAAFWLPFQEIASGNHIAQWVTEVERQPCFVEGDCPTGEFCEDGVCVPIIE